MATSKTTRTFTFAEPIESIAQLEEVLKHQSEFYSRTARDSKGYPARFRVSGQLRQWKRDTNRIRLPLKHGFYDNTAVESIAQFNEHLALSWTLNPAE